MPLEASELSCPQLRNVQVRIGTSHINNPAGIIMYLLRGPNNDGSADVGTRIATSYKGIRYTSPEDHRRLHTTARISRITFLKEWTHTRARTTSQMDPRKTHNIAPIRINHNTCYNPIIKFIIFKLLRNTSTFFYYHRIIIKFQTEMNGWIFNKFSCQ